MEMREDNRFSLGRATPMLWTLTVLFAGTGLLTSPCTSRGLWAAEPAGDKKVCAGANVPAALTSEEVRRTIDEAHAACYENDPFPSAKKCQLCHDEIYREWSVSQHAYAQLSPVFNAFSNTFIKISSGTNGDFCIRCHTPVGMALNEPINISQMDRPPSSREGVTCVVCHRINQAWGRITGRQHLEPGNIHSPVYGPQGNAILEYVIAHSDKYGVLKPEPNPEVLGRNVHHEAVPFFQMITPSFCGSCHDVFGPNGFRLEDAFSEFKMSPAARCKKENCQDCHMGIVQGIPSGYLNGPAAHVGNAYSPARKRTNHMIIGPDYSIIHPGLFPHHPYSTREENQTPGAPGVGLATMREWLAFDVAAGWGTDAFEQNVPRDYVFPKPWQDVSMRYQARAILDYNFQLLDEATAHRRRLLTIGYQLSDIVTVRADRRGIRFKVKVWNGTDGHSVPTGFDTERVVFLQVTVRDNEGNVVYKSGDYDPNGDFRDSHSVYVHNGELPLDKDLFSLQSKFIARIVRGGEREQDIVLPYSLDPLPYVRPEEVSFTVLGRPLAIRKQKHNIEIYGHRWAEYEVKGCKLKGPGPYHATVKLITGMIPINLIDAIKDVGFDYGMSPRQVGDNILAGHLVIHERQATFDVP